MLPVVDAHHHIWRQADLPWLQGPSVPRIFGPYDPIKRDYPIDEYLADIDGQGVVMSIYVQTNWAPGRAVDEVAWVQEVARARGYPHAIVGYADLAADDVGEVLAVQARHPLLRGIRQQLHWHENALYRFAPRPDIMNDAAFRRGLARLQDHGLLFELQVFASQMADGARLARDFPGLTFVLAHAGMPEDTSPAGRAAWEDGMKRLADQPNVATKLSGLGTFIHRNHEGHIRAVAQTTIEIFGPERCLFGSNFPIEKLWTDYPTLLGTYRRVLADFPEARQRTMLHDNAIRLYRL
jgi:predicted TIM-barrel fold metal-dependent hydrolase